MDALISVALQEIAAEGPEGKLDLSFILFSTLFSFALNGHRSCERKYAHHLGRMSFGKFMEPSTKP